MEEFQVSQQLGVISSNLDDIETELKAKMEDYKDYEVTKDTITADKKVLADLRKLKTSMEDARKKVKSEWEKPYKDFEAKYKAVLALVEEPINEIDSQLKAFEEQRAAEKKLHVREIYDDNIEDLERFLPFDTIFNSKWLNASTKDQDIVYDISEKKLKVKTDLDAIKALGSEIEEDVIDAYVKAGNNLATAIQRNNQYIADKNRTVKQMEEKKETKPVAEAMGTLNDMVNLVKTVHFIVSKDDAEDVENLLTLSGFSYRKVEEG